MEASEKGSAKRGAIHIDKRIFDGLDYITKKLTPSKKQVAHRYAPVSSRLGGGTERLPETTIAVCQGARVSVQSTGRWTRPAMRCKTLPRSGKSS
jgi:hypothetical protein